MRINKILSRGKKDCRAFTLIEVMISTVIMALVIVGILQLNIYTSIMADMSGRISIAISDSQSKMDEIRNTSFSQILTNFPNGTSFNLTGMTGKAIIQIDSSNANLYKVTITSSWQNKDGRVIGEDANLDGVWNSATEDANGNGQLDSIIQIVSLVARRT